MYENVRAFRGLSAALLCLAVASAGCGGGGGGDEGDAGPDGDVMPDAATGDASADTGTEDSGGDDAGMEDAGMGDAGVECTEAADCDDGLACTTDSCDADGLCVNEPDDTVCDDGNPCTTDTCGADGCSNSAAPDDTACTDSAGSDGMCAGGVCVTGCTSDTECDDGIDCTTDTCDTDVGACSNVPDDSACDDGVDCTADSCSASAGCEYTPQDSACSDGFDCTTDTCDATEGCLATPEDSACDDGVSCTTDSCSADSGCASMPNASACDDGNPCTTNTCDDTSDCQTVDVADGTSCTVDGDAGLCQGGSCEIECTADSECDDGDACNGEETCNTSTGECQPGTAPTCNDGVDCTTDTCDSTSGCVYTPDDGSCDDGNPCTADSCDATGGCESTDVADDTACTDTSGNSGTCQGGSCIVGCSSDGECDDGIDCTTDSCNTSTGNCTNTTNDSACDDGVDCTTDTCSASTGCQNTTSDAACDDGNECTVNTCDASGGCETVDAMDGVSCTNMSGDPGLCLAGSCNVECTSDADCSNDDVCDGTETCDADGQCQPGTALTCSDGIGCTTDSCDPSSGCVYTPDNTACDDSVSCTTDACSTTSGCTYTPDDTACDDGNPCTANQCDQTADCEYPAVMDGTSCTVGGETGTCQSGTCQTATSAVFRATSMNLADPHAILDYSVSICNFCDDITNMPTDCFGVEAPALNPTINDEMATDSDGDGYRDLSFMIAMDPLAQDGTDGHQSRIVEGLCDDADPNTCEPDPMTSFDSMPLYDTQPPGGGTCLAPFMGTTDSPWPDGIEGINMPSGGTDGCFATEETTITLQFEFEGNVVTLPLQRARVAGQFSGTPATGISNGLVVGFLTQADADAQEIDVDTGILGVVTINLGRDILPDDGDAGGNCAARDHCDDTSPNSTGSPDARDYADLDGDGTGDTCGWWIYLNYSATQATNPTGFF